MHCSSRKLLPSGGHSWEQEAGKAALGGTRPDKGIFVQAGQEVAAADTAVPGPRPAGWPLLPTLNLSGSLEGEVFELSFKGQVGVFWVHTQG